MFKAIIFFLLFDVSFCQSKWIKTYGADELDGANHILTLDDGYLITGFTSSFGNGGKDLWIIKTDKDRKKVWDRFYGGMYMETGLKSMKADKNGFIVLAQTHSYGSGSGDIWVVKIDSIGNLIWEKTYGNENLDTASDITTSNENGFIITGTTISKKTNSIDGYIMKIDTIGNVIWSQIYGGLDIDGISSVSKINDEYGYMLFGYTKSYMLDNSRKKKKGFIGKIIASILKKGPTSEAWLINIDEYGDRNWHITYGGKKEDIGKEIKPFSDGSFLLSGETNSSGKGEKDIWLIKIDGDGKILWESTIGSKKDEFFGSSLIDYKDNIIISGQVPMKKKFSFKALLRFKQKNETKDKLKYKSFIAKVSSKGKVIWEKDDFEDQKNLLPFLAFSGNNLLLAGQKTTPFNGGGDAWILKLNSNAEKLWEANYGGRGADGSNYAYVTEDGGYISVGYTDAYGYGKNDVWVIKTDFTGEKEWSKVYGGKLDDYGWGITQSTDGGFGIVGETYSFGQGQSDIYLFKIDSAGNKQWQTTFGGLAEDVGYSVVNTDDDGFIVASQTRSYGKGGSDGMIVKFNVNGKKQWSKVFGGKGMDYFKSIARNSSDSFIVGGGTRSFSNGDSQGWALLIDKNGYPIWEKTFGDNGEDGFNMIASTKDNSFIGVGYSASFFSKGLKDILMVKIDSLGKKSWMQLYGGRDDDKANAIYECKDGGFVLTGETNSYGKGKNDIFILKTNQLGDKKWMNTVGGSGVDIGRSVQELQNGGFIISGTSTISNLSFDSILIKADKKGKVSK